MIAINVTGMAELTRRLEAIRREVASHILPEAGHAALAPVLGTMRQCAERGATQAAAPFIRPALDHHKHQVLRILAAHVRYGIENR